eukprot:TRINITY_DN35568_c0_g1_i1.p1 TRINITY_DN35568_c0_g1~~TRINITY_DN35568_c0_g1_i1.p1  ORF type:complete len:592 (+),score=109.86 TRINITY_DN35568_c0_g1_i1:58-1833(+)
MGDPLDGLRKTTQEPFRVQCCRPVDTVVYVAPGAKQATQRANVCSMPPKPPETVRVVCISDTHNEHDTLRLPEGDVLVHSGDCLTESGHRYVTRSRSREILQVHEQGIELFRRFATWFGAQPFNYKVLVAGNHDLVLQGLGQDRVQEILDRTNRHGTVVYLEHREARVGPLRVFGSPFSNWGSHNDAFRSRDPSFEDVPGGIHILVTHAPCMLPDRKGAVRTSHPNIASCMHRTGALLHVCGHCHWARGVYTTEQGSLSVCASVCDSHWAGGTDLQAASGVRGDPVDRLNGGYNMSKEPFVVDLPIASGPSDCSSEATFHDTEDGSVLRTGSMKEVSMDLDRPEKPRLLLFGPHNDPDMPARLKPVLSETFHVDHADTAATGCRLASIHQYAACVAKLGTEGNLGEDVVAALRAAQGTSTFVALHSATAVRHPRTQEHFQKKYGVTAFFDHGSEKDLVAAVRQRAQHALKRLLFFAPPTDPDVVGRLLPYLKKWYEVDVIGDARQASAAAAARPYAVCIAKLGSAGNKGVDVINALRTAQGADPFIIVHSATAAGRPDLQQRWSGPDGVDLFFAHNTEDALLARLQQRVTW